MWKPIAAGDKKRQILLLSQTKGRVFLILKESTSFKTKNAPRGSHCGGLEVVACSDPPQAENLASEILCSGNVHRPLLAIFTETWYTKLMPSVKSAEYQRGVGRPRDGERFECMDCKKAQGLITAFINEQLNDDEELQAFLAHVEHCAECREELEVTYSLLTAMKQLDEDTDLSDDYIADLNQKIEGCYIERLKKKRSLARRRAVLVILIMLLLLLNGITVVEKREEVDRRFLRTVVGVDLSGDSQVTEEEEGMFAESSVQESEAMVVGEEAMPDTEAKE